jgi:hypothetical protein
LPAVAAPSSARGAAVDPGSIDLLALNSTTTEQYQVTVGRVKDSASEDLLSTASLSLNQGGRQDVGILIWTSMGRTSSTTGNLRRMEQISDSHDDRLHTRWSETVIARRER